MNVKGGDGIPSTLSQCGQSIFCLFCSLRKRAETRGLFEKQRKDKFARQLEPSFLNKVRELGQASTLISQPPRKRVTRDNKLEWQEGQQVTDAASLFNAVRRARNNLFHGEKFIGDQPANGRNKQLLIESLWVLEFALSKNIKVRKEYDGADEATS